MRVQALVPEPAIEGFNERIVCGLAGAGEVQRHLVHIGPLIERSGDKLWPIVHPDLGRCRAALERQALHHCCYCFTLYALVGMDS